MFKRTMPKLDTSLKSYLGPPKVVHGTVALLVIFRENYYNVNIFVVDEKACIVLSAKTCQELNSVKRAYKIAKEESERQITTVINLEQDYPELY